MSWYEYMNFHLLLLQQPSQWVPVYKTYLLRIHWGCAKGIDDHHVGTSIGVHEIATIALPKAMNYTRFIKIEQWRQVLWLVIQWRIGLHRNRERECFWIHDKSLFSTNRVLFKSSKKQIHTTNSPCRTHKHTHNSRDSSTGPFTIDIFSFSKDVSVRT